MYNFATMIFPRLEARVMTARRMAGITTALASNPAGVARRMI